MKKVIAALLMAIMMLTMVACSKSETPSDSTSKPATTGSPATTTEPTETKPEEVIQINYTTWSQEEQYKEVVRMFNESQDKIQVKFEVIPTQQLTPLINKTLGTPDAPDIIWGSVSTEMYAAAGLIEPLDKYVERDNFDLSVFYPAAMAQQYRNGVLYGLPKGIDTYVMAYNTKIFDKYGVAYPEEGWSWTDVDRISRELHAKIKAAGGKEYALGMMLNEITHWFLPMCVSNGASFFNEDNTKCLINSQNALDMVNMTVDLIKDGVQADYTTLTETNAVTLFTNDLVGIITLPSYASAVTVVENSQVADHTKLISWPKGPATGTNYVSNTTTNNFVMNAGSKNKDAAWEFMKFLTSEEADAVATSMQAHLSARISSMDEWIASFKNLDVSLYGKQVEKLAITTFPDQYLACLLKISPNMLPVWNGEASAEEGLNNLAKAVDEALAGKK
jgi:multiple sugar transport system substrate-binding protein